MLCVVAAVFFYISKIKKERREERQWKISAAFFGSLFFRFSLVLSESVPLSVFSIPPSHTIYTAHTYSCRGGVVGTNESRRFIGNEFDDCCGCIGCTYGRGLLLLLLLCLIPFTIFLCFIVKTVRHRSRFYDVAFDLIRWRIRGGHEGFSVDLF